MSDKKIKELYNHILKSLHEFIDENPQIIKGMAMGYNAKLSFNKPKSGEKTLQINCKLENENGEMTLNDLFKTAKQNIIKLNKLQR